MRNIHKVAVFFLLTLVLTAMAFGLTVAAGGTGIITVSSPTKAADDTITVNFKDKEGVNQSATASTGQSGTNNSGDDLPKDMSADDKAKRYKEALDATPLVTQHGATVTANGSVVTVSVPNGSVRSVNGDNQTKQKDNGTQVHGIAAGGGSSQLFIATTPYTQVGTMFLTGTATGYEDGGVVPSSIMIGTNRGTVTVVSQPGQTADELAWLLAARLRDQYRIVARRSAPGTIEVLLHQGIDGGLRWGGSDDGIGQQVEVGAP